MGRLAHPSRQNTQCRPILGMNALQVDFIILHLNRATMAASCQQRFCFRRCRAAPRSQDVLFGLRGGEVLL